MLWSVLIMNHFLERLHCKTPETKSTALFCILNAFLELGGFSRVAEPNKVGVFFYWSAQDYQEIFLSTAAQHRNTVQRNTKKWISYEKVYNLERYPFDLFNRGCWSLALPLSELWNAFFHIMRAVDFVLHAVKYQQSRKGFLQGQYREDQQQQQPITLSTYL